MDVIREAAPNTDLAALGAAWEQPSTFAFIPEKAGVTDAWLDQALASLPPEHRTGHFALLTSGSTGLPKLVVGNRKRAERLAAALHVAQDSEDVAETIVVLPLSYCYAFVNQWLWARQHRRALLVTPGIGQPDRLKTVLHRARGAMLCLVGAQVSLLLRHFAGERFLGILRVHFAGGRFPQENLEFVRDLFPGAKIFNNYGCAEAMPRLTVRRAEESARGENVGRPLPGVELATGDDGGLLFRSTYGAVGYVDTSGFHPITSDTWVATGDLGHVGADGSWELQGRASDVFKRYGEKVALPQLLATVSAAWPGQATFYRELDRAGECGHVLVLAPRPSKTDLQKVLRAFRASHPRPQWPLRIESADTLPRVPNGKIDNVTLASSQDKTVHWKQRI